MVAIGCLSVLFLPLLGLLAGSLVAGRTGALVAAGLGLAVALCLCLGSVWALVKARPPR
ncbi:hypothetical protein [Sphingomonas morindae]|uniref:Uncharacterized protein n=1 Tax=Sphingomonas morindae TaxID=1541170 RepID=A0ABY4X938_9SPHN|nr:hypothetical protein [Sphingomonas morindae]USI73420.1 hypothetical protein LHA26_02770 [Sphingomonas morindae]